MMYLQPPVILQSAGQVVVCCKNEIINKSLYLDSPYKTVAEKEKENKENLTKLNYD